MSTPMPSPSMNGMIGLSGVGSPGTIFAPSAGTWMCVVGAHSPTVSLVSGGSAAGTASRRRQAIAAVREARVGRPRGPTAAARAIAAVLLEGFDRHYRLFRAASAEAKEQFERGGLGGGAAGRAGADPSSTTSASRECVDRLRAEFDVDALDIERLAGGEARLHRPARRPLAARARRDVLQLGDHADPAPDATSTTT